MKAAPSSILVVDDNIDTAKMMKVFLKREGYTVQTAYDGPEALEVARTFLPDVVLLDLTLPSMSGREVASELRKVEGLEDVLIVVISGYANPELPPGCSHHLVKPLDHEALLRLLAGESGAPRASSRPPGVFNVGA